MIIVIVGPTGVGKTKLSVALAKKIDAEIINADSMQIYKNLDIGTAKVQESEKEKIVHHLFDIKEVNDDYSVYDYQKDCRKVIDSLQKRRKNIILVGGTGLYIKAALCDYKFQELTSFNEYNDLTNEEIYNKLKTHKIDFDIHINNRKRLVRLLNKLSSSENITTNKDVPLYDFLVIGLTTAREKLYSIINSRVDKMMENGLLDEVSKYQNIIDTTKSLQTGIGYKEFRDYFNKSKTLDEIAALIKKNSRHYAKRQYTFFNHQFKTNWFEVDFENFQNTVNDVHKFIVNK